MSENIRPAGGSEHLTRRAARRGRDPEHPDLRCPRDQRRRTDLPTALVGGRRLPPQSSGDRFDIRTIGRLGASRPA